MHEEIALVGPDFKARLQIDAEPIPAAPIVLRQRSSAPLNPLAAPPVTTRATPAGRMIQSESVSVVGPSPAAQIPHGVFVAVQARRVDLAHWELRWARPNSAPTSYRVEERILSLDGAGELQTNWRDLTPPEVAQSGDDVLAQIKGLAPKQLHMLRVTAVGPGGGPLWESPLVALEPPRTPPLSNRSWLLVFGLALVVFLVLRWRWNRALA